MLMSADRCRPIEDRRRRQSLKRAKAIAETAGPRSHGEGERGPSGNLNSGKALSEMGLFDLRHSLTCGYSVEESADFLRRRDSAEVRAKAAELGADHVKEGRVDQLKAYRYPTRVFLLAVILCLILFGSTAAILTWIL
jgi:hypothetical protein